jgi:hypothetical protein
MPLFNMSAKIGESEQLARKRSHEDAFGGSDEAAVPCLKDIDGTRGAPITDHNNSKFQPGACQDFPFFLLHSVNIIPRGESFSWGGC